MNELYKAKRSDNGEWIIGGSIIQFLDDGERSVYMPMIHEKCICVHDEETDNILGFEECKFYKVDPETLCKYIGKDDKNGNKIFKNDRIQFEDVGEEGYEYKEGYDFINTATVVWNNLRFELSDFGDSNSAVLDDMNNCHEDFSRIFETCEVIGNIFDNLDLMEGTVE